MTTKTVLYCSKDERERILQVYGRTPKSVKKDIEAIRNWLKKQPHLPEITSDDRIEGFLAITKFRIEKAKQNIDMYYTIRTKLPEFFSKDPDSPDILRLMDAIDFYPLPRLTEDLCRVGILRLKKSDIEWEDPLTIACLMFMVSEVGLTDGYFRTTMLIADLKGVKVTWAISTLSPIFMKKVAFVIERVYSNKLDAVHIINAPPIFDKFVTLVKSCLNPKLASRMSVHRDSGTLTQLISKKVLPKDFGGEERSFEELNSAWRERLLEIKPRLQFLRESTVQENLRPKKAPENDCFGFEGNFRKLDID